MSNVTRNGIQKWTLLPPRALNPLGLALTLVIACSFLVLALLAQEPKASPPEFNLTLAGDALIATPEIGRQGDAKFMGVVNAVRKGDAAVLNYEGSSPSSGQQPVSDSGGTWMSVSSERLKDLQWIGFNLFSAANNHSVDFGTQGLLQTLQVYNQGGAVYAGIGENLGEARAPGYLSTPHGRVALISCASTFSPEGPASASRSDMQGHPGLSALHHHTRYRVDAATFETLTKMKQTLKLGGAGAGSAQTATLGFDGSPLTFEVSDKPGVVTTADPTDLAEITHEIRDAKEMADYVVTYTHSHEQADELEVPSQFLVEYAHAAIYAGDDVFGASGPHVLRGIEIYKGKVIFYSLGDFIQENDLVVPQPAKFYQGFGLSPDALPGEGKDAFDRNGREPLRPDVWESVVANVVFRNGRPAEVILTPIWLGFGRTRTNRGRPEIADSAMATKILERLQKLSEPFGTKIVIKDGLGIITITSKSESM